MITKIYILVALSVCSSFSFGLEAGALVDWRTPEGLKRLLQSSRTADFSALANQFVPQPNVIFCAPTTAVIVLNALRLDKPRCARPKSLLSEKDAAYLPKELDPRFSRYTTDNFFTPETDRVKTRSEVMGMPLKGHLDFGIQLRQLNAMLEAHGLQTTLRVVDEAMAETQIGSEIEKNLGEKDNFVIVNYYRKALDQKGSGHVSPVGAYDEVTDSYLVLDVNPNAAGWTWVKAKALIAAMRTKDSIENRGYILVSEGNCAK